MLELSAFQIQKTVLIIFHFYFQTFTVNKLDKTDVNKDTLFTKIDIDQVLNLKKIAKLNIFWKT